jgi:RNA polymerase sigma-70 factor, ECF subfamily
LQNNLTPSDNELIIEARKGSDIAFSDLVQRYDRRVFQIALKYFKNEDDAKDVYQDVFIRVYKSLNKFEFKSEFSTWIFRITTNVCLTHKMQAGSRKTESLSPGDEDDTPVQEIASSPHVEPENEMIDKDTKRLIQEAVDKLPPKQRMVFTLKHDESYKIKEIAEMMKCSEGTVKKYLFLAVNKLKVQLKNALI